MGERVLLSKRITCSIFSRLYSRGLTIRRVALRLGLSERTLREWRRGDSTMSLRGYLKLLKLAKTKETKYKILSAFWYTQKAGRIGGQVTMSRYGNIGTSEGRRRGGMRSLQTHRKQQTGFQTLKQIRQPQHSIALAELMGVLFGDGHLSTYQASVVTSSETDTEYARYVKKLFDSQFAVDARLRKVPGENTLQIVVSSKKVVDALRFLGMPLGNKLDSGLKIPLWISASKKYSGAFIRGLFDTDGCVYFERKVYGEKKYAYIGCAITSYSPTLRCDVINVLRRFGLHPTNSPSQTSVFLRRRDEVDEFFSCIGTNNPKHARRFKRFIRTLARS